MQKQSVRFVASWGAYNAGERAGFTASELARIPSRCYEVASTEGEAGSSAPSDVLPPSDAPHPGSASPASEVAAPDEPENDRAMKSPRRKRGRPRKTS